MNILSMIAVAPAPSVASNGLPVNWFDAAVLVLLVFGIFRGRKNGMTRELAPLLQWLAVVIAAGLAYAFLASVYANQCGLKSKVASAVLAYLSISVALFLMFTPIKQFLKKRAENGGVFGGSEYYLGMLSGPVRYACMILFALALLNARSYTGAEIAAKKAYNERWYGGGMYSGDYMPDIHSAQEAVFKQSFSGPYIQNYLGMLLIQTGPGSGKAGAGDSNEPKKPQPVIHIGS
ncbi:MAG TPA: CvpA family protein [Candidatus Sulfotelmatobacter sp.]|nr:CvpA family protein [Candidatus Sulfotelmatobacter sp.]